jgi:hypothetical protein
MRRNGSTRSFVMAGLDPAIHEATAAPASSQGLRRFPVRLSGAWRHQMDGRIKSGHDGRSWSEPANPN